MPLGGQAMEIDDERFEDVIQQAVTAELQKLETEKKAAELDAASPKELTLQNVLKYSGALPETAYTRDTIKNILTETIGDIERWDYGKRRINEDVLGNFLSAIDRESRVPTTKEAWLAHRAEKEAENERQRVAAAATIY
jgi:hypothetical protein